METILLIADFLDRVAHGGFDFFLRALHPSAIFIDAFAADFAREHHQLRGGQRFARDARFGVFGKEQVDNGVADLVSDFVRMAFGNGFRGEEE